jgi:hypothetical protein
MSDSGVQGPPVATRRHLTKERVKPSILACEMLRKALVTAVTRIRATPLILAPDGNRVQDREFHRALAASVKTIRAERQF